MRGSAVESVLNALQARGQSVRQSGSEWNIQCPCGPCHDTGNVRMSATMTQGDKGAVVHCHHGSCNGTHLVEALGLGPADLFDEARTSPNGGGEPWVTTAKYRYRDEGGNLVYTVHRKERWNDGKREKKFSQQAADGAWTIRGTRRVPYRLPELLAGVSAGEPVWIAEGEKDVATLVAMGLCATTTAEGAGNLRRTADALVAAVAGAERINVVIDDDIAGRGYGLALVDLLGEHRVTVWCPTEGNDITDHVANGGTLDQLTSITLRDTVPSAATLAAGAGSAMPVISSGSAAPSDPKLPRTTPDLPQFEYTDMGNGRRLVATFGSVLRYSPQLKSWLEWTGERWRYDVLNNVTGRAKYVVDSMATSAATLSDHDERKAMMNHYRRSQSAGHVAAMVKMAETEPGIPVHVDDLDRHPMLFNVANGTIDLTTGELREHWQEDLLTKTSPVTYDPEATCPQFAEFVTWALGGDTVAIEWLQAFCGYLLTGLTVEQCILFLVGFGKNGKSTLIDVLMHVLGEYGFTAESDLLLAQVQQQHTTGLTDIMGRRLVVAQELDEGKPLAEARVKQLTGDRRMTARKMHCDNIEFDVTAKFVVATNHKPNIRGTDNGIWRRLKILPFNQTVTADMIDKHLPDKLRSEASGILNWMLAGLTLWRERGLGAVAVVDEATEEYRADQDHIGRFIEESVIQAPNAWVTTAKLRQAYEAWCDEGGERPWSQVAVGKRLAERGFVRAKDPHTRRSQWHGIGLLDDTQTSTVAYAPARSDADTF